MRTVRVVGQRLRGFNYRREGNLGKGLEHGGTSGGGPEICGHSLPMRSRAGAKRLLSIPERSGRRYA